METKLKKHSFSDWVSMTPGAILGGFIEDNNGIGIGTAWGIGYSLNRFCLSEYAVNIKNNVLVGKITSTGVRIYYTNNKELGSLIYEANSLKEKKKNNETDNLNEFESLTPNKRDIKEMESFNPPAYQKIYFEHNKPIGIFLGSLLRVEDKIYVNLLTRDGLSVWLQSC